MSDPYAHDARYLLPPEPAHSSGKLIPRIVVLGTVALVMMPVLVHFAPREIARWYLAAAQNAVWGERLPDALRHCDTARAWSPDDPAILYARAGLRLQAKDLEGSLEDYDTLVRLADDGTIDDEDVQARVARSVVYQRLGRHSEAIADWDYIVEFHRQEYEAREDFESQQRFGQSLNNAAYARALGNQEIAKGLEDIQLAFEVRGRDDDHTLLDTLGYLQFLNGELEPARKTMEDAIQLGMLANAISEQQIRADINNLELRRPLRTPEEKRYHQARLVAKQHEMAVLLHHRGEVYEALKKARKAARDFRDAEKLGYNPAEGVW